MSVLSHSVSKLYTVYLFLFPYSVRNILKNFQNCSQPDRSVGELDQPVFSGFVRVIRFSLIEARDLFESGPFAPHRCRAMFRV